MSKHVNHGYRWDLKRHLYLTILIILLERLSVSNDIYFVHNITAIRGNVTSRERVRSAAFRNTTHNGIIFFHKETFYDLVLLRDIDYKNRIYMNFRWTENEHFLCDLHFLSNPKCASNNVFVLTLGGGVSVKIHLILGYWNMTIVSFLLSNIIEEISSGLLIWRHDWRWF